MWDVPVLISAEYEIFFPSSKIFIWTVVGCLRATSFINIIYSSCKTKHFLSNRFMKGSRIYF